MSRYLLLGAGASSLSALRFIKKNEQTSDIYVAFSDNHPYSRMLTPYYLTSKITKKQLYEQNERFLKELGVKLLPSRKATKLFTEKKYVEFDDGRAIGYDKLLIATGSIPVVPKRWSSFERVVSLWEFSDVEQLKKRLNTIDELIIIGSGFIGMIFANALYEIGKKITIIEKLRTVLPKMLPENAALIFEKQLTDDGINLVTGDAIRNIEEKNGRVTVFTENGRKITADLAVMAIGVKPNINFLNNSGIKINSGVIVDENMKTNDKSVYAAGDIAEVPMLNDRTNAIYPTWPEAVEQGRAAGFNMAGKKFYYRGGLSYNTVTFGKITAASFGRWNDTDAKIIRWKDSSKRRFIQFCIRDDRMIGACLVGESSRIGMIKGLIEQGKEIDTSLTNDPSRFANWFLLSNYFAKNVYKG